VNLSGPKPTFLVMTHDRTRPAEGDDRPQALDDEWLAIRCQLGEAGAFEALVSRWHGPLWRYARHLLGDDDRAADVSQDIWLRVVRGIGRLREPAKLRAWLFGIARRAVMDRLRLVYAAPGAEVTDVADEAAPPDDRLELEERHRALDEEIDQLPVIERDVLVLFYLQNLSLQQLAEVMDVPIGTIKSRLFRARRLLRQRLEERGVNP